jgi:uncharacterized protein with HEPN domain
VDWDGFIGMRHRLVHDYVRIRWERVWKLLQADLPVLIGHLNVLIPANTDEGSGASADSVATR